MANVPKAKGARKGDRVTICLPMIPQGCGHAGLRPDRGDPLGGVRRLVITADEGVRGGKIAPHAAEH